MGKTVGPKVTGLIGVGDVWSAMAQTSCRFLQNLSKNKNSSLKRLPLTLRILGAPLPCENTVATRPFRSRSLSQSYSHL